MGPVKITLLLLSLVHEEKIHSFPRHMIQGIFHERGVAQKYFQLTFINVLKEQIVSIFKCLCAVGVNRCLCLFFLHFPFCMFFHKCSIFFRKRYSRLLYSSIYMVTLSSNIWLCPRKLRIQTSLEFLLLLLAVFKIILLCMNHTSLANMKDSWTETGLMYSTRQWIDHISS